MAAQRHFSKMGLPPKNTLRTDYARETAAGSYNQERSIPSIDPIMAMDAYFATRAITQPHDVVPSAIKECAEKHLENKIAVGSVSHQTITALPAISKTAHFVARNTISTTAPPSASPANKV
ncbi:hypothetical protein Y032_0124g1195 [Ancylostoma ceylanicum]|uniref:Uncharacterized protein n=1 Tax=Ancylostoma ceylanicum TaxID=53326 RepID=A0A016T935_9BILA|nr:hypothetical protein Y032_0124g1195 [Ancylostoma ceylanicum]